MSPSGSSTHTGGTSRRQALLPACLPQQVLRTKDRGRDVIVACEQRRRPVDHGGLARARRRPCLTMRIMRRAPAPKNSAARPAAWRPARRSRRCAPPPGWFRTAAGDLRGPAGAAMIGNRDLEDAQAGARRAHLHLDVPAIGHLVHAETEQKLAPNGAERAHVGVANAVEQAHPKAGQQSGGDLCRPIAAGLARPAQARRDHEVEFAGPDRSHQGADARRIVGAVAVHENHDLGVARGLRPGQAGPAIAAAAAITSAPARGRAPPSHQCCRRRPQ